MIKFTAPHPSELMRVIERADPLNLTDRLSLSMDLCAANTVCPLDWEKLLGFPDFDFAHDIVGIYQHLNRETGQLDDFFVPRCARRG